MTRNDLAVYAGRHRIGLIRANAGAFAATKDCGTPLGLFSTAAEASRAITLAAIAPRPLAG